LADERLHVGRERRAAVLTAEPSFDVYTVPASRVYEMSGAFAEHAERAKSHARGIGWPSKLAQPGSSANPYKLNKIILTKGSSTPPSRAAAISSVSHGRSGIAAIVLGSVTRKVLTHTKIPVLVCH